LKISNENVRLLEPFGFLECCIFRVPNITIRDVTERPETLECGSNMLTGVSADLMLKAMEVVLNKKCEWEPPAEYLAKNVSSKVVKIILGYIRNTG